MPYKGIRLYAFVPLDQEEVVIIVRVTVRGISQLKKVEEGILFMHRLIC